MKTNPTSSIPMALVALVALALVVCPRDATAYPEVYRRQLQMIFMNYPDIYSDVRAGRLAPLYNGQGIPNRIPNQQGYINPNQQGYINPNQQGYINPNQGYVNPQNQLVPNQGLVNPQQNQLIPNQGLVNPQQNQLVPAQNLVPANQISNGQQQLIDPNQG